MTGEQASKLMYNVIKGEKGAPKFLVVERKNEYGGKLYTLLFHEPPNGRELNQAVRTLDDCPFGFGIKAGKLDGITTKFQVKVYND